MAKPNLTYQAAFTELQEIIEQIESGDINLDELGEKVKRASLLLEICRKKLTATEADVQKILEKEDTAEAVTTKDSTPKADKSEEN